jgi:hypothetical protein
LKKLAALSAAAAAIAVMSAPPPAHAATEDVLVGAFDQVTGVPVMGALLELVRSGESTQQSPDVLDRRLREVETLLHQVDGRLRLVESKVGQLQNEVVRLTNLNRLRELQRIRAEIEEINAEMLTHPVDPGRLAILEFRARQQADLIRDSVAFDIWKWTDVDAASGLIRTRFRVMPSFELYGLALTTWFTALDMKYGDQSQRLIADSETALREHAAFLRLHDGWHELRTDVPSEPQTLLEHLYTAAYCRLAAIDTYSDAAGNCSFAEECVDRMEDRITDTGRLTVAVQPPVAGTLCTWNPDQERDITGELELRAAYGERVMASFADALDRLATTGSLRLPFVGSFDTTVPESVLRQRRALYALNVDEPLIAPPGAAIDVQLAFKACHAAERITSGCRVTPELEEWSYDPATHRLLHVASGQCLNISGARSDAGAPIILYPCSGAPNEKWTVVTRPGTSIWTVRSDLTSLCLHALPGRVVGGDWSSPRLITPARLAQMPCDGSDAQLFSNVDADWAVRTGPH